MTTPAGDLIEVSYRFNQMSSSSSSSSIVLKQSFEYMDQSFYLVFGSLSASAFFLFLITFRIYYFMYRASKSELIFSMLPVTKIIETRGRWRFSLYLEQKS